MGTKEGVSGVDGGQHADCRAVLPARSTQPPVPAETSLPWPDLPTITSPRGRIGRYLKSLEESLRGTSGMK